MVDRLGHGEHLLGTGRLEHIADGAAVEHALAHIAQKQREVSGAASGRNAHLARVLTLGDKAVKIPLNAHQFVGVRGINAFQHFGNECFRCVDDFFHRLVSPLYDNALFLGKAGEYPFCDTPPHAKSDFASRRFKEVF